MKRGTRVTDTYGYQGTVERVMGETALVVWVSGGGTTVPLSQIKTTA